MALEFSHVAITVPLVSLAEAKAHLRITDALHDVDIQQKLDTAQEEILAKLGAAADATWTATTAPRVIRGCILMLLEALYDREYNATADAFMKSWEAINQMLGMYRDPALG